MMKTKESGNPKMFGKYQFLDFITEKLQMRVTRDRNRTRWSCSQLFGVSLNQVQMAVLGMVELTVTNNIRPSNLTLFIEDKCLCLFFFKPTTKSNARFGMTTRAEINIWQNDSLRFQPILFISIRQMIPFTSDVFLYFKILISVFLTNYH